MSSMSGKIRRRSKRIESSLTAGMSPHVVRKLQQTRSLTGAGLRRSVSRSGTDISRMLRNDAVQERCFVPETFELTKMVQMPHKEATEFQSEHFDANYFANSLFTNKETPEIDAVIENLTQKREECNNVLKEQVFGNYARFIDSTTRLQQLESDMSILRRLYTEQQQTLFSLSSHCNTNTSFSTDLVKKLQREVDSAIGHEEQRQMQNTLSIFDELDSLIAERKFGIAVDMLEKELNTNEKQKSNADNSFFLKQIQERVTLISELLCREIQNPSTKRTECHRIIEFLIRLRESTLARDTLLNTRWETISKQIREMKVEGELVAYIAQLSKTVFSFLSSTCKEYQQTFKQPQLMSAFVVWATEVLDLFASIFTRHVFTTQDHQSIAECLEIANQHCLVLENEGLMLSFYLQRAMKKSKQKAGR